MELLLAVGGGGGVGDDKGLPAVGAESVELLWAVGCVGCEGDDKELPRVVTESVELFMNGGCEGTSPSALGIEPILTATLPDASPNIALTHNFEYSKHSPRGYLPEVRAASQELNR